LARCCHRTNCLPMRRRCRCSIPAEGEPRPGGYGATRLMIGHGPALLIRQRPMSIPRIAGVSTRPRTWPHSGALFRLMATQGSPVWSRRARMRRSGWLSVGPMRDGRSTSSTPPLSHRSPLKCWHASANSTRSKRRSEVNRRMCVRQFVSTEVAQWSKYCTSGYKTTCRACLAGRIWRKPCVTHCGIGTG
jgi:hypothetical protein